MKKLIIVLILLSAVLPVFAQSNSGNDTQGLYYINVPVEKVYLSHEGYVVQYRKGVNQIGTIGIPYEWFTDAAASAEIMNLPTGRDWPSISVFYKGGEFAYVKLYVHRLKSHITWSMVPQGADVSRHFKDKDSFSIEF